MGENQVNKQTDDSGYKSDQSEEDVQEQVFTSDGIVSDIIPPFDQVDFTKSLLERGRSPNLVG